MSKRLTNGLEAATALIAAALVASAAQATVFTSSAADAAGIQPTVDAFRAAVGATLNDNDPATPNDPNGRREINWDGVPVSDPAPFAGDFFNGATSGRSRGLEVTTPGTGFLVSANAGGPTPILFGFGTDFAAFSAQKIFTAIGSNITDVRFFSPLDQTTPAVTRGFGAIFTDVETADTTKIEFFDRFGALLESQFVLPGGNASLSFLGATFASPLLARVRITSGANTILANGVLGNPFDDVVAMDDFIYGEPLAVEATPVPAPAGALLLAGGLGLLFRLRRAR
jgi:hypothetical protein